jgi:hypothetical protein
MDLPIVKKRNRNGERSRSRQPSKFRVRASRGDGADLFVFTSNVSGIEIIDIVEADAVAPPVTAVTPPSTNHTVVTNLGSTEANATIEKNVVKRVANDFKKYHKNTDILLCRATFECGLPRSDGARCEHMIGLFYRHGDPEVEVLPDGGCMYKTKPLAWGNTIAAVDKRTQRKLAQTWRAHFLNKHGWNQDDSRLPVDCRIKWKSVADLKYDTERAEQQPNSSDVAVKVETDSVSGDTRLGILIDVLNQSF